MDIKEYLSTKIKNKAILNEIKTDEALYVEVQNDYNDNAAYNTLDITNGMKKYKYGFVM